MLNINDIEKTFIDLSNEFEADNVDSWPVTLNGPYMDHETPLRTASHMIKINAYLYKKQNNNLYKFRLEKLFLLLEELTDSFETLIFRKTKDKDSMNGLIGPAWLIEGLHYAYEVTKNEKYLDAAENVYKSFEFNTEEVVWYFKNDSGEYVLDPTFNHQLWFATQALKLRCENGQAFLEKFIPRIKIDKGIIFHLTPLNTRFSPEGMRQFLRYIKYRNKLTEKSVSYHAFNLIAICNCYRLTKNNPVWQSKNFSLLQNLRVSESMFNIIATSKYGLSYNPQTPAYLMFGHFFSNDTAQDYIKSYQEQFSNFLAHEISPEDALLRIRNYEFIDYLDCQND